jgi:hypothetical protein
MLGPRNLQLSGDVMGVATRAVEARLHAPALFVNGAVGDASPRHHGAAAMAEDGRALGEAVWAAWNAAKPIVAAPFAVRTARIDLPSPALPIRQCVGAWVPSSARVPLGLFLPAHTEMIAVALGRVAWVTMPGEPVSALGATLRAAAGERWAHVLIAGVSNDYLGYFVRSEDYGVVDYVTCAALYGPQLSRCLTATAADLLHRLPKPGTADARTPACEFAGE